MAIGARDRIDRLLVQKYSDRQVDNHENRESAISADDVMTMMSYISTNTMNHVTLSRKLSIACYGINSMSAQYKASKRLAG